MYKYFKLSKFIAGVDEVGRGSLAGPVLAAAVILNLSKPIYGLIDSKKLRKNKRFELFDIIINKSISWNIGRAEVKEIDNLNILNATMLAMRRAINGLNIKPNIILVDGNTVPVLSIPTQTIIKGDNIFASIAAASILAKVIRDQEMTILHNKFPKYEFIKNKGYPTPFHIKQLFRYGITIQHRRTFNPIRQMLKENMFSN